MEAFDKSVSSDLLQMEESLVKKASYEGGGHSRQTDV